MNNKQHYTPPLCEVIALETIGMMAMSGQGKDSDDSEFFGPSSSNLGANGRRGKWGDLWSEE